MNRSTLVLVISLVLLNLVLAAGAYQIGRQIQRDRDDRIAAGSAAEIALANYTVYSRIAAELEKKCYDAALSEARGFGSGQVVVMADNLRMAGNMPDVLDYIGRRNPDLLKSVRSGHLPELRDYETTCP